MVCRAARKREILLSIFEIIAADAELNTHEKKTVSDVCFGLDINDALFASVWLDCGYRNKTRR
jgi:hypothetical protein